MKIPSQLNELRGECVVLKEHDLLRRQKDNKAYVLKIKNEHLLRNYHLEAGRLSIRGYDTEAMGGWETATCQLRGHFLGHWLSAAALDYEHSQDSELKGKADAIIDELEICQKDNGGQWVCSIPEKYLTWIGQGKNIWAPQYTIHKLFMGLLDVYTYMQNKKALTVADNLASWFLTWSSRYTQDEFDSILDVETGGMLEVWCQLYEITGDEKYKTLATRYYRRRLFEPLLQGKDVLTNMHANTTIPEVLGCAKAYEVFGETKYFDVVKKYWECAVTTRGFFATGGQTQGEIWTPKNKLKARLGDKNQEHCTVYNMIRLAEFLFRHTKDVSYMHYIEYNVQNGLKAQSYWQGESINGKPATGLLTYFLPMMAPSRKDWAGENDAYFCCHGTMIQANAAWNRMLFYRCDDSDKTAIYVTQYANSDSVFYIGGEKVTVSLRQDYLNGSVQNSSVNDAKQTVNETAAAYENKPDFKKYLITVHAPAPATFTLNVRIPDWITREATVLVNDSVFTKTADSAHFVSIGRTWQNGDTVTLLFPIGLRFIPLPDDETMGAFRYGSEVLVGITNTERVLKVCDPDVTKELTAQNERQWGEFRTFYKTEHQDPGIPFVRINDVGYEPYQMYFKVIKEKENN